MILGDAMSFEVLSEAIRDAEGNGRDLNEGKSSRIIAM
jgi:hypothetical protein